MTAPLSPAAAACLRELRELYESLERTRGTHDQATRVGIIARIRDVCDRFLRLTAAPDDR